MRGISLVRVFPRSSVRWHPFRRPIFTVRHRIDAFESLHTDMKLVLAGGSSRSDSYVKTSRRHESDRIRFLP